MNGPGPGLGWAARLDNTSLIFVDEADGLQLNDRPKTAETEKEWAFCLETLATVG